MESGDGDGVQGPVRLTIPAPVESMPAGFSRRRRYRCRTAEIRELRFAGDPFPVVTEGDQQLRGSSYPMPTIDNSCGA